MTTLAAIEERLRAREPAESEPWLGDRAAVAVILRAAEEDVEVLLIRRAERDGDPWSGHMAFPGGRRGAADRDIEETARRETLEEIGLDLAARARRIGRLADAKTKTHGRWRPLTITPIVYALEGPAPSPFALSTEVAGTLWVPLGRLKSGALDGVHVWRLGGVPLKMPCWTWEGCVVWGLTHRMLSGLLDLVDAPPL